MKRIKLFISLGIFLSLSFFISGIYGYMKDITNPVINTLSMADKTSYTLIYEIMNLDGTTYSEYQIQHFNNITLGTEVTPVALPIKGFTAPETQSVVLDTLQDTTITYRYTRNQYSLTINNSEYVTTSTPSGTYYYGTSIHLIASDTDNQGNNFARWSDNTIVKDYTFYLSEDTTIGPIYANTYTISFEPNNGDAQITLPVIEDQPLGYLPSVSNDDCVLSTGNYDDRQCTYAYKFQGWYTESNFVNQVNEDYVPSGDCTLYAKWTKVYFGNEGPVAFNGTSDYIDTGIKLFSEENAEKDFIVTFTVDSINGSGYVSDRGTIFANMNEKAEPYPGVHFFYQSKKYWMNVNILGNKVKSSNTGYAIGKKVTIKREQGIIYYKYDNGSFIQINDFSDFDSYFDNNATFGAGTNGSGSIYRYFKGTLSDMSVELFELPSYTIHFDPNGGTGMMIDQDVVLGKSVSLTPNAFTNSNSFFGGWNTKADGSGHSFLNRQDIIDLGDEGDVIILYAQWVNSLHYYVRFDANGGTGSMENQEFHFNQPAELSTSNFVKNNYIFTGWNTKADGTGNSYIDGELVENLSDIDGDVVTLYAQYLKPVYAYNGIKTFDGTIDTFIDTGVNLHSATTLTKDFEIRFTVNSIASNVLDGIEQPTLFNNKDEANSKYPGFNVRINSDPKLLITVYRWRDSGGSINLPGISISNLPVEFIFRRRNQEVSIQFKYNGFDSGVIDLYDQRKWQLNQYAVDNATFGGIYNSSHLPDRFLRGELSNMQILIAD